MPIAVHAIGDLAFEYVLNAIEPSPPKEGQRDRLIHAQIVTAGAFGAGGKAAGNL